MRSCFFFNDTATTEIYTLSLHDALPIFGGLGRCPRAGLGASFASGARRRSDARQSGDGQDRKSTRLNSSHSQISYAVFCLKKKKLHLTLVPENEPVLAVIDILYHPDILP